MISRFDTYDFIANLIPGLVFLWCVQKLTALFSWNFVLNFDSELIGVSILIAIGYVTGLLLQGVSQGFVEKHVLKRLWKGFPSDRWLLSDDKHFSSGYKKRLLELITEQFKVSTEPDIPNTCSPDCARELCLKKNHELFYLCYHKVGDSNQRPLIFNAQYGLFRCLLTMFAILAVASLGGLILAAAVWCNREKALSFGVWTSLFAISAIISYARCKKRGEDFAQSIFDLFIGNASNKSLTNEKPQNIR